MMRNSKKGVALEQALIMLLVVFGFCLILVTVASITKSGTERQITNLVTEFAEAQIEEDFLLHIKTGAVFTVPEGWEIVSIEGHTLKYKKTNETSVRILIADSDGKATGRDSETAAPEEAEDAE